MTQSSIPTPETRKRLVSNLRQTRLELQEFGLQLEEVLAALEQDIQEQKVKRLAKLKAQCSIL
ncbi:MULTISPECIES: hypothetical protein [Spirulina sp. CCY15215]|uniref:hypothetical protein n=1 Tax=Spirulina sp. CCY15215 TaxID=2767591 RepID=UPI00194F42E6|nr:hypothetical protein [Spirulina major]